MLRNVLEDYLESVDERQFDVPFLQLLAAMGFHDVHYTHGAVEFGKDFIAKYSRDGEVIQYSFQSKAGDINHRGWRDIQPQILEAAVSTLSHPNFSTQLPHQTVLVTTGDLRGNAGLGLQNLNAQLQQRSFALPVIVWSREQLIDHFLEYGVTGILRSLDPRKDSQNRFMAAYADAGEGSLSSSAIEQYSRTWTGLPSQQARHLRAAIESEVLSQRCLNVGRTYETVIARLAFLRHLHSQVYIDDSVDLSQTYVHAVRSLHDVSCAYTRGLWATWGQDRDLLAIHPMGMNVYLVQCARTMELASIAYFTTGDAKTKRDLVEFLRSFVEQEPGCSHPLSDRYAVSIVMATLVLYISGHADLASKLVHNVAVWVFDRYEAGLGLGGLEDDEKAETFRLLGHAFDFLDISDRPESFLATALVDLCTFIGDVELYSDIVNDIAAAEVHGEYQQPQDTLGSCLIGHSDILNFPSLKFEEVPPDRGRLGHDHFREEGHDFRFVERYGPSSIVINMALLRDRYYPTQWHRLLPMD